MHVGEMLEVAPAPSSIKATTVLSSTAATAQTPSPSRPESSHSAKQGLDENLSCKNCKEVGRECKRQSTTSVPVYWSVRLDTDLLETLIALYPEWFKDCPISALKAYMMADNNGLTGTVSTHQGSMIPLSPPKCEVDDSPLKKAMDKNKESLKVKLMMRRPISQLVDQGIMPPLKTPILFHEQQKKLERAKMGDMLKHKIQHRPDRSELVRQHILEDTGKVAPSLAEKQRLLKKAKLADSLNDQLAQRPGPLELIQKNILHTDESVERAVKEGHVPFRPVSEAHAKPPTHPSMYITIDDENSSDVSLSPAQAHIPPSPSLSSLSPLSNAATPPHQTLFLPITSDFDASAIAALFPNGSQVATLVGNKLVVGAMTAPPPAPPPLPSYTVQLTVPPPIQKTDLNRDKQKKKILKPKTTMKKTIKFHEYKGPNTKGGVAGGSSGDSQPSSCTTDSTNFMGVETPYELLLQQQQLILQLQIDQRNKMVLPMIASPAKTPTPSEGSRTPKQTSHQSVPSPASQSLDGLTVSSESKPIKWEDFKVSDLKAELKKRSLPVSGAKPQLIERLKPYWDQIGKAPASAPVEAKEGSPARQDMIGFVASPAHSRRGSVQAMSEMPNLSPMPYTPLGLKEEQSPVGMLPDYPSSPMQSCNQRRFSTSSVEGNTFLGSAYSLVSPASTFTLSPAGRPSSVINMDIDEMDQRDTLLTPLPMNCHDSGRGVSIGQEIRFSSAIDNQRKPPTPPPLPQFSSMVERKEALNLRDESGSLNLVSIDSSNQVQLTAQEVIRQQQAKIEELLKQLKQQQELMRQQTLQNTEMADPKQQQKLLLQQHIQNRAQTHHLQQQLQQLQSIEQAVFGEPPAPTPTVKPKSKSKKKKPVEEPPRPQPVPAGLKVEIQLDSNGEEQWAKNISVSVDPNPDPVEPVTGFVTPHRSNPLPTFADLVQSTMEPSRTPEPKAYESPSYPQFYMDPPQYQEPKKEFIKSQMVDDVLDILIRNGELPASAAQEPPTPSIQLELNFSRPPTPPPLPNMPLTQHKRLQYESILSESEKFDSILKESLNRELRSGELKIELKDESCFRDELGFEDRDELSFVFHTPDSEFLNRPKPEKEEEFGHNYEPRSEFPAGFDLKFEIADQKCDVFFGDTNFLCDKAENGISFCDPDREPVIIHEPMHFEPARKNDYDFPDLVDMETNERMDFSHFDEISPPCTPRDSIMLEDPRTNQQMKQESMDMDVSDWLENIMSTQFVQPLPLNDVQSTVSSSCSSYSGMSSASKYYDSTNNSDPLLSNCTVTLNEMLVDDTDIRYHNSINSINWEKFDFTA